MLAKRTSKNQLTLPKEVVNEFPGVEYYDVKVEDRKIVLTPVKIIPEKGNLEEIREKIEKLGIRENDVIDAIKWARKKA